MVPAVKTGSQSGGESSHPGLSLREFARRIGVSDTAVRKAVAAGRFKKSLRKTDKGKPFIADFEGAKVEWNASSRTAVGVRTDPRNGSQSTPVAPVVPSPPPRAQHEEPDDDEPTMDANGQLVFAKTLIDAQTAATNERARKLKFENDVTEGRLIPIERVTKEAFEAERIIRESILNLPARLSGELAAETDAGRVYVRLDAALREALNSVADTLLATVNE